MIWGIVQLTIDVIGWYFMYLFIVGYFLFIVTTSKYNWLVTILQFFVVGFLSFMIIGFLYNEVYEPYIERTFPHSETIIATTIGLCELIIIKLLSDIALSKSGIKLKISWIEKILLPTIAKCNAGGL